MFSLVGLITPHPLVFAYDVAKYDKTINKLDIAYKTVFGECFRDPIRFRGEFAKIVESLMALEVFSKKAVEFTKIALQEMVNNGIIRIGCGKGDYFNLIKELSKECDRSIWTTYYYPEVKPQIAIPTWLIEAPDKPAEKTERQATVQAYNESSAKDKVRIQLLTPIQFKQLQATTVEIKNKFLKLISGFRNYYGGRDAIEKDFPKRFLFEDYVIFNGTLMLQYDYNKGILTLAWTGERFNKALAIFNDLDNLRQRKILQELSNQLD